MDQIRARIEDLSKNRDECVRLLAMLDSDGPELRQALSKQQAASITQALKRKLMDAPKPLQKRYVQGLVSEIIVAAQKAVISGPPIAIAAAVSAPDKLGEVRTLVREWRTQQGETENWRIMAIRSRRMRTELCRADP